MSVEDVIETYCQGQIVKDMRDYLGDLLNYQPAYDAPFPGVSYKAGVRRFPAMVMTDPDMEGVETSKRALQFWREQWSGESFMAVGAQDPVLGPDIMERMRVVIRGCPEALILPDTGHFVQESGDLVAAASLKSFGRL